VEIKVLLDTTAYVAFRQNNNEVIEYIVNAEKIFFSPIVLGELLFGFRNGMRFNQNMADMRKFLHHPAVEIVPLGELTSDRYSRIAAELKRQGTPIPTNDIWIAAQTMEQGAELVTLDRHFKNVKGLVYTLF